MIHLNHQKKKNNLKLYVRKVFITDDSEELCPDWMSFVKGIVDFRRFTFKYFKRNFTKESNNESNEKNIVKKCLEALIELSKEDDYDDWYKEFSKNIKLAIHEDSANRDKLSKLLKYKLGKSDGKLTSLSDYIKNMKENQQKYIMYQVNL